jgi:hypothetical protein
MNNEELKKPSIDDRVIDILKLPKYNRHIDDLHYLLLKFKGMNFLRPTLKKFGEETVRNLLNCLTYLEVPPKQKILVCGEEGRECYVLLDGEIDVYTPDTKYENLPKKYWVFHKVANIAIGNIFGERSMVDRKPRYVNIYIGQLHVRLELNVYLPC